MSARFREIAPGVIAELVATRIEMTYVPAGLDTPDALTAVWWAQDYLPIGGGYQRIGEGGARMTTVLADHAGAVLEIVDPVTQETVSLSAAGAVTWLKAWFDHQYNAENGGSE